jgi:hypothetical protein
MPSFAYSCVTYVSGIKGSRTAKEGEANIMQEGALDLQHGTGVDGNWHPYVQSQHPKVRFLCLKINKPTVVKLLYLVHNTAYFSPLQLKIKHTRAL